MGTFRVLPLTYLFKQWRVFAEELLANSYPAEIYVVKTNICLRSNASRANILV